LPKRIKVSKTLEKTISGRPCGTTIGHMTPEKTISDKPFSGSKL
jgi:hypothetical protein